MVSLIQFEWIFISSKKLDHYIGLPSWQSRSMTSTWKISVQGHFVSDMKHTTTRPLISYICDIATSCSKGGFISLIISLSYETLQLNCRYTKSKDQSALKKLLHHATVVTTNKVRVNIVPRRFWVKKKMAPFDVRFLIAKVYLTSDLSAAYISKR